jgi:hypothetical protein
LAGSQVEAPKPHTFPMYNFFGCQGCNPSLICSGKRFGSAAARNASFVNIADA